MSGGGTATETVWSWRDRGVLLLLALAILLDGVDNQVLGLVAPAILADWQIDKNALAPVRYVGQLRYLGDVGGGVCLSADLRQRS